MEDLSNYPNLKRRGNKWHIRKRVPADIADMYKSETVSRSLKTDSQSEATKLYHKAMLEIESEFELKRKDKLHKHDLDQLSKFHDAALLGLAFDWYTETQGKLESIKVKKISSQYTDEDIANALEDTRSESQKYEDALLHNDLEIIYATAQNWLNKKDIKYDVNSTAYDKLCRHMLEALHFTVKNDIKELTGKQVTNTIPSMFDTIPTNKYIDANNATAKILLTDLLEKFLKQTERQKLTDKANNHYRTVVERLNDYAQKSLYIDEINRSYLEAYRDALLQYPSRAHIHYKNKSFQETLKLAAKDNAELLNIKTINTHLHCLHALFDYAELNDYVTKNPVKKLTLNDPEDEAEKRHPWPLSQLTKMLSLPFFTEKLMAKKYDEALYWFCLISLWTGMSKKEISQLQIQDLKQEDGILYLDVVNRPEADAKLKNPYRVRRIPIHSELIKCGLPEFFKKRDNHTWLFHELPQGGQNGRSHYIGKVFSDLIMKNKIKIKNSEETGKCGFHSLRHNYRDALRDTEMNKDIQLALGGWSSGEQRNVADNYGSGYTIKKLNENVQKISYDGLDLSHLHIKDAKDGQTKNKIAKDK